MWRPRSVFPVRATNCKLASFVSWEIMQFRQLKAKARFGGRCCLHIQVWIGLPTFRIIQETRRKMRTVSQLAAPRAESTSTHWLWDTTEETQVLQSDQWEITYVPYSVSYKTCNIMKFFPGTPELRLFLAEVIFCSWRWKRQFAPKCQFNFNGLHGTASQKIELFTLWP